MAPWARRMLATDEKRISSVSEKGIYAFESEYENIYTAKSSEQKQVSGQ